eukprot:gnl/MRDRNA2_/MRDRNA2_73161_c0_seq1.p1 gnl/MRDRNA2_/MRDRNA2_73161_c0~~gnl/MRDRNA2_/MRDRNA2_73161_c0_seq1.p1  ORF type:complete len:119 (-),score=25.46 gnl/MRDRNA2_/MRDRNA2_73161_c0_seq1:362-718(-)
MAQEDVTQQILSNATQEDLQQDVTQEVIHEQERPRSGIPPVKIDAPTSGAAYASIFYKRTNQAYGSQQGILEGPRHGLSNRFSGHLATSGMWRNNSLNTTVEPPRFADGTKDWMLKNA